MKLLHVKTARFAEVVKSCGAPEVATLWTDPKDDKPFQRALREDRVMTVHQAAVGTTKDFAEVGIRRGANVSYLVFPKSLKLFADRRVIGIRYDLLAEPEPRGEARPTRSERAEPARKTGAKPKKQPSPPAKLRALADPKPAPAKAPPPLDPFMLAAIHEARKGLAERGIPIGAALVRDGRLLAVGHNKRVQDDDPVTHAETDCLRNAGRLGSFRGCTLYSTLMPCYFCAGAAVQFGIAKVVVGESRNFPGAPELMRAHGIEVIDLDLEECRKMMAEFIRKSPRLWNEDIGT